MLLVASIAWHARDLSPPGLLDRAGRLKCPDFLQFYTYGSLVRSGESSSLYDPGRTRALRRSRVDPAMTLEHFHPNYSPAIAWLFAPLAGLPYLDAMTVWTALSVALYGVAVALLLTLTPRLRGDPATAWLAAAAFPTVFVLLRYGQISAVSLLLMATAACLSARRRDLLSGLVLGCLAYKPNLLLAPGLIFLAAGEWRLLAGLAAGAALQVGLSIAAVGWPVFAEYAVVLVTVAQHPEIVQIYPAESHSVAGQLRLWSAPGPLVTVGTLVTLGVASWIGWRVWRQTSDPRPRWAAIVIASLIASPHLLTYDLLLLAAPIALLVDWRIDVSRHPPVEGWLAALLLLYFGAMPGTMLARMYGVQCSTVGMALVLWLLAQASRSQTGLLADSGASSSISPSISS